MQKKISAFAIVFLLAMSIATIALPPTMTKAATASTWDFEDHSYNHVSLTTLTSAEIVQELQTMDSLFQQNGLPAPKHFAYPNGDYNNDTIANILSQNGRLSGRTDASMDPPYATYPVSNWYSLPSANLDSSSTISDVESWINSAVTAKGMLILFTHEVSDPPIPLGTTPTLLRQVLEYLVAQQNAGNLSVMTMKQAYAGFTGQNAVVVMAFDDAYSTDYSVVWPMFKEYGLAGTSYLVGDLIGTAGRLTWTEISEMATDPNGNSGSAPVAIAWAVQVYASPLMGGNTSLPSDLWVCPRGDLSITAYPASGYVFSYWLFDGETMMDNPVIIPSQVYATYHNLTAVFTLSTEAWMLALNSSVGGTTSPSGNLTVTGPVTVNATADANYTFSYWQFDSMNVTSVADLTLYNVTSTNTTSTITVPTQDAGSSHNLTAFFSNLTMPVAVWSLSVNSSAGGTTVPSGAVNVTDLIVVNATADANYTFSHWQFDTLNVTSTSDLTLYNVVSTNSTSSITIPVQVASSNHTLTAFFTNSTQTNP